MANFRYISDNPFRLMAIGSSATQRELRTKAAAVEVAAKVGLAPDPGLAEVFGFEERCHCVNIVIALANEPVNRTIHRLFWPFALPLDPRNWPTLEAFDRLLEIPPPGAAFHLTHLTFLRCWFHFSVSKEPQRLAAALARFRELYDDVNCDLYLQSLLEEDGVDPDESQTINYEAQNQTLNFLLTEGCRAAVNAWSVQDYQQCSELVQAVIDCGFADDAIDEALIGIVPTFDREIATIQAAMESFDGSIEESEERDLAALTYFSHLAKAVQNRVPAASLWLDCVNRIARSMRDCAIDIANDKRDYKRSLEILAKVRLLCLQADLRLQIEEDLVNATSLHDEHSKWNGILPIGDPPSMWTINGMGLALYRQTRFDPKPGWYFATLYFVLIWVPVVPIQRFLVSDAPNGGKYFHGRTRLSRGNWIHLWMSLALVLLMILHGFDNEIRASLGIAGRMPVPNTSTASTADASDTGDPRDAERRAITAKEQEKQERIVRLQTEYDALTPELKTEDAALTRFKDKLRRKKVDLDAEGDEASPADTGSIVSFNKHADQYNQDREDFNNQVSAYNAKVKRLNQIVQALKETGN